MPREIRIGLFGAGVVGGGTLDLLSRRSEQLAGSVGCLMVVRKVLVRDLRKVRAVAIAPELVTTDPAEVLADTDIQVVIELMGGEEPAREYIAEALARGKHVVTANKEVIAKHGYELLALADANRVDLFYEASVGGGIPVVAALRRDLIANEITSVQAIVNGTTNYILTEMEHGHDYDAALRQAQALGYAEADPRNDVEGIDAAYKLAILATLAFRSDVRPKDVHHIGISRLDPRDFSYAAEMGYVIKLIAQAQVVGGAIEAAVYPTFIPRDHHLAAVKGVFNAILLDGDQVDKLMLYGQGAGAKPTSSAVVADLCRAAHNIVRGVSNRIELSKQSVPVRDFGQLRARFYLRMQVVDRPGVLAQIAHVLGAEQISIASLIQKETDEPSGAAEIVIMTHLCHESEMEAALAAIARLPVVREVSSFVRVGR